MIKRILITGANSYIGTSVEKWLAQYPDRYYVDTVDMISNTWKEKDFSKYDVVFHVAGIAHVKETKKNRSLYYKVNRDLAYETAKKAKVEGVKQFIFLSSMSVYGIENGVINENTPLNPKNNYGKSKLQAEKLIRPLNNDSFRVAILRPPMVYGKGCKGNYQKLEKIAKIILVFPDILNQRSMIYIDNLCEFVRLIIDNEEEGIFFPQNKEYVCTAEMVSLMAKANGKKVKLIKLFNPIVKILRISIVNKVFGNLVYDKQMSQYKIGYYKFDFEQTIK